MKPAYRYKGKLERIVDGDTLIIKIDYGFHGSLLLKFRLLGVNTPETYGVKKSSNEYKRGILAKDFVAKRFHENNDECIVVSHKTGSFGRWLAEIYFPDSNKPLNQELIDKNLAEKYEIH